MPQDQFHPDKSRKWILTERQIGEMWGGMDEWRTDMRRDKN